MAAYLRSYDEIHSTITKKTIRSPVRRESSSSTESLVESLEDMPEAPEKVHLKGFSKD